MAERRDWIEARGWRLIVVHRGPMSRAKALLMDGGRRLENLEDPNGELYAAFGLSQGSLWRLIGPAVWGRGLGALLKGHFPGKPGPHVRQMPGAFLIDQGQVVSEFRARHSGDHPDLDQMDKDLQRSHADEGQA